MPAVDRVRVGPPPPERLSAGQGDHIARTVQQVRVLFARAEQPFFDDKNELTSQIQARVDYCANYHSYLKASTSLGEKLAELELLDGQQATFDIDGTGETQSTKTYVAVNVEKFGKIDAEILRELHADGLLSAIYAHLFSLDNWNNLLQRYKQRRAES